MSRLSSSVLDLLPPVPQLLFREVDFGTSLEDFYKQIDQLLPEFRRQAEFSMAESVRLNAHRPRSANEGEFVLNLVGALDPFSETDKCPEVGCRVSVAESIARFAALYADVAYVQDSLTAHFAFSEKWNHAARRQVLIDVSILTRLLPLIQAGVLKFSMPAIPVCRSCLNELLRRIDGAAESVITTHAAAVSYTREGDSVVVNPQLFDDTASYYVVPCSSAISNC